MSKHKKHTTKATNKNKATATLPAANLEQQARQALENKQYKQAIQHLKTLLKQAGENAQVMAWLHVAYTGRAEQLAAQGMLKEAIIIWETATPYGLEASDARYLGWLLKARQYPRLLALYRQFPPSGQQLLQAHLAAAALSGETALLASLPENDPVRNGYAAANSLLEAWCAGAGQEQLQVLMQSIPFRSPYRDLRQTIQAWLGLESAPAQVADALARIASDSPFHPLAEQVRLAQLDSLELLPQLAGLTPAAHTCQLAVRGWSSPPLTSLLKKLEALGNEPNASRLFAFLAGLDVRQAPVLLQHWRRDMLKKAWVIGVVNASPPLRPRQLEQAIGVPPQLEKDHLHALAHTTSGSPIGELLRVWGHYRDCLLAEGKADSQLAAAQIERYLAGERERQTGKPTARSVELLQQSLHHDPSSAETWAKVLEYYLQQQQLKPARDTLKAALEHHPDATALLELGIRIAIAGDAFKKAATYAGRILAIDPINTRVRQYLQNAHLAHARKQIRQQKWHLADKELQEAQQWKSTPLNATLIQVLQACCAFMQGNAESARQLLEPLGKGLAKPAAVRLDFILRHESALTMTPLLPLLQAAGLEDVWKKPHTADILVLMETARQFQEASPDTSMTTLAAPLDKLRSILLKSARLPFTAAEGEKLCEFWLQAGQDALLDKYATALEKAHPDKPLFTYYRFVNVDPFEAWRAVPKLEDAWEQARNQGDVAASSRIGGLLDRLANPYPELDDDEDSFDAFEDAMADMGEEGAMGLMAELVPMMPLNKVLELAYDLLDKKTVRLLLEKFGEQAVRDLCQSFLRGDDPQTFIEQLVSGHNPPYTGRLF